MIPVLEVPALEKQELKVMINNKDKEKEKSES